MSEHRNDASTVRRRDFLKTAGAGVTAAGVLMTDAERALAQGAAEKARLERIARCTWPIRQLFKTRGGGGRGNAPLSLRRDRGAAVTRRAGDAGESRSHDDRRDEAASTARSRCSTSRSGRRTTFPGVTRMDSVLGPVRRRHRRHDVHDRGRRRRRRRRLQPDEPSGRKWLDQLANKLVKTGTKVQHISNNAPFGLADFGSPRPMRAARPASRWPSAGSKGCAVLGVKSMRMNSPQALGPSIRPNAIPRGGDGYPRNLDIVPLMDAAIESYKEMADFGGNLGIKVTFENHWGLAADPMNLRIMIDTINHPYCDATPDFCNWEHEYMLFNGLKALAPYATLERPREVLGSLGRQERRAAVGAHHARRRVQGHVRARVRSGSAERRRRREVSLQGSARRAHVADAGHLGVCPRPPGAQRAVKPSSPVAGIRRLAVSAHSPRPCSRPSEACGASA